MPKLNLDDEIANAWEAYVKSEQPDEPRNPKKNSRCIRFNFWHQVICT